MIEDPFIKHLASGHKRPAFVDSVGNGAMFGELVSCAVMLTDQTRIHDVNDSKQLDHSTIYYLAGILRRCVTFSFGVVSTKELNELGNINRADALAMRRAVEGLPAPDAVFVDGHYSIESVPIPSYPVIKGDSKVYGIAVASIIAKNYRDRMVSERYGDEFARYHIRSNKGYRSPDHLMALKRWGVTKHHRAWQWQVQRVLSGQYDEVIQRKYLRRWEELCRETYGL